MIINDENREQRVETNINFCTEIWIFVSVLYSRFFFLIKNAVRFANHKILTNLLHNVLRFIKNGATTKCYTIILCVCVKK